MADQRYAILIGNSEFPHETGLSQLRCPPFDVQGLAAVLEDTNRGHFQVTTLVNQSREIIERRLFGILNQAGKDDLVLIYFSGHGWLNRAGQLYLAAHDTKLGSLLVTAVAASQIKTFIDDSYCNRIILILDCCHSGAIEGAFITKGDASGQVNQVLTELEADGLHIMTASTSVQSAYEKDGDLYSVFTTHLIGGMETGAADKHAKGVVSFNDLFGYIEGQLKKEGKQKPLVFNIRGADLKIAHSGKSSRKDRCEKIEPFLLNLHVEKRLTHKTYAEAMDILKAAQTELTELEIHRDQLLDELHGIKIDSAVFVEKWIHAGVGHVPVVKPVHPPVILQPQLAEIFEPQMIAIPAGSFMMGSPATEKDRGDDELQHKVTLSAFYLGQSAVTKGQFGAFVAATRYLTEAETGDGSHVWTGKDWVKDKKYNWQNAGFAQTDQHPVVCVSWNDAQAYIAWLNEETGKNYRLPTEAEWEYAARAGTTTPFSFGDNITPEQVNYNGDYPYAGGAKGLYRAQTVPVKSLPPNPWDLYEMHGNVWEWCSDWYGGYKPEASVNPSGPEMAAARVLRGGSWIYYARFARSASRYYGRPVSRSYDIGFRFALGHNGA